MGTNYTYTSAHPHAAVAAGANSYQYDSNGNMTCRVESGVTYSQAYNAENRISSIAKLASGDCSTPGNYAGVWNFSYDGDGTRVAQLYTPYDADGNAQAPVLTAYFMGGMYETQSDGTIRKYYSIAGQTVAVNTWNVTPGTWNSSYLLTDHLGSVVAITDSTGTLTSQRRYLPFGEPRTIPNSPITKTDFTYTGQRANSYIKLLDYRARWLDPELGRFTQPDSIVPDPSNPQNFNRYSYVLNRPINLNDPTGHDPWWDDPDFYYADLQTYIKAGITVQKENGLRSRGAVYLVDPLLGKDPRHTGIGPAKISDAQMETPYGDPVIDSSGHNRGYGLGMRTQSCGNACPPDVVDQDDDNMAKVAMGRRITLAIKACMTSCTPTDIYLAAALAENGSGFTQQNMHDLMYNKKTLPRSTSGPAMLDWKDFLNDPNHTDSNQENKFLINSFTSAINDLPVPPGLDWNFITQVSQP